MTYLLDIRFRPMADPEPRASRKRSQFRSSNAKVLNKLREELFKLGVSSLIVEAGYRDQDIRQDGWPYSSAKSSHPAVRLSFKGRQGPMAFECGTYTTLDENLYAIALTLEALRTIERYGAVKGAQQYKGWKQLPPPPGAGAQAPRPPSSEWEGPVAASNFLRALAGFNQHDFPIGTDGLKRVYNEAARKHHPDVGGGNDATGIMAKINSARDYLEKHMEKHA